jgi:hypothetical protein
MRERVVGGSNAKAQDALVTTARRARSMAELIRRNIVEATGGRTYVYTAFRLSELTVALGASFVAVGIGLAAMSHRLRG